MAGFFSLGSGTGTGSGRDPPEPPLPANTTTTSNNSNPNWAQNPTQPGGLLLYRNEEIHQKGFEIWQQYVQVHHHHPPPFLHHHHHLYLGSGGGGDPYYPSPSSAGPSGGSGVGSRVMMRPGGGGGGSGSGGMNCQDCGNQAKKDCAHMRCRTCCKSRGFDCATHVKSTWVPAAKRRERHQQQLLALQQQQQPPQHHLEILGTTREKRLRESRDPPPPPPQLGASTSGLEVGQHFPAELSSQAVFRCVRVHSVDDPDEQLAYQTSINVGGHLFKGILYDQGPESHPPLAGAAGDSSSGGEASGVGNIQPHSLLTAATSNEAALVDPNAMYPPPPISAFLAGTQFFPPPRS